MDSIYFFMMFMVIIGQYILNYAMVDRDADDISDTSKYKQHNIIGWILLLPVIASIWILDRSQPQPLMPLLFALPFIYRGYMEMKYLRETKRHKVSFIITLLLLSFAIVLFCLKL